MMNQSLREIIDKPLPFTEKARHKFYYRMIMDDMWGANACEIYKGMYFCWKWGVCPFTAEDVMLGELIVLYDNGIYKYEVINQDEY